MAVKLSGEVDIVDIFADGFIYDHLITWKQRTKIEDCYKSWRDSIFGVLQGLILGPLLFNHNIL